MDGKEIEFKKHLQAIFKIEAEEHVRGISAGILELEKKPKPEEIEKVIEQVFREAHSLKGAARVVDIKDIVSICQPLESIFSALKAKEILLSSGLFDLLHKALDVLSLIVSSPVIERTAKERLDDSELIKSMVSILPGAVSKDSAKKPNPVSDALPDGSPLPQSREHGTQNPSLIKTVRIPLNKLEPLLFQAEEMMQLKMSAGQHITELKDIKQTILSLECNSIKLNCGHYSAAVEQNNEQQENNEMILSKLQDRINTVAAVFEQDHRMLSKMVNEQLETIKQVLMLPVETLLDGFPRFVRDLSHDQGKQAELNITGSEIEIDKQILEGLKDPLIHLIRNCVGHGIEKPAERVFWKKPAVGKITLAFSLKNDRQVEILISDDGAGISTEKVINSAVKTGIITKRKAAELNSGDALALIFKSGISTSPVITEISGRGLGLAIVSEQIEKFGGTISLETKPGAGTVFRFLLPLTLTTFKGILVKTGEQMFVCQTSTVKSVLRVKQDEIATIENCKTIKAAGLVLSAVRLGDVLEIPALRDPGVSVKSPAGKYIPVVIVSSEDKTIAFMVDEILGEHQFLVKSLGRQLKNVRNVSGAAILGSGRIVPVLNIKGLIRSAVKAGERGRTLLPVEEDQRKTGKIIVVEDSITSRTLLKSILGTAGYQVATAVDGEDAFAQLKAGGFDLVVSDVDMPKMNGFELTARIRADKKLSELPVILVTALNSREDRERGIDAGANAHIIKSSFDQSDLLEVISKLI